MNERVIDYNNCVGCGLCVNDCVNHYLQLVVDDKGKKIAHFLDRGRCINCGHCNAICPQNAIKGGELVEFLYDSDSLLLLMASKRSIRKYNRDSNISETVLNKILFAGETAPTGGNRKSSKIILVKEQLVNIYNKILDFLVEDVVKKGPISPLYVPIMRLNENREDVLWNAEYLVLFVGAPSAVIDSAIAAERMQLEAHSLGVGTVYRGDLLAGINNVPEIRDLLEIRKNESALVAFAMGNTMIKYQREAIKNNHKVIYK